LLFRNHANERSITHRLAVRLERRFEGWDVDCEYSRIGNDLNAYKKLLLPYEDGGVSYFDAEGSRVYPDVIIHHRGENTLYDNLLVIEVKTVWSQMPLDQDIKKLQGFTGHFPVHQLVQYQYGLFLMFDETGKVVERQLLERP